MKKVIEQIKAIYSKIKSFWIKVVAYLCKKSFVLTFPLVVFTGAVIVSLFNDKPILSLLWFIVLFIWGVIFAYTKYEDE